VIAVCLLASACGGGSSEASHVAEAPTPAAIATPPIAAEPTPPSEAETPVVVSSVGPLEVAPVEAGDGRLPHEPVVGEPKTPRHASEFGWSSDGESFVLCIDGGGPRECTFTFIDGKAETLSAADGLDARLRADGHAKGGLQWAHGRGVELTWSVPEGKKRLEFGAELDTGERAADLVWMDFDPEFGDDVRIFPEVIAVSSRGDRIAVVGHAHDAKRHEFKTTLLHSDDFAARAYAKVGFDHLAEDRFEQAVSAFERAAAAHPNSWEAAYNLACARARHGQGNVRRPLTRAIDLGGEKVRTKAQRDAALAGVKRTDWFKAMVATEPEP
jgi:hypothetical protein